MPESARAGAVLFAKDLERVSSFYQHLLSMTVRHEDAEHQVLASPDFELIIHAIPAAIASTFSIASPPQPREDGAIKLFFTVPSLTAAATVAEALGGQLFEHGWSALGYAVRNGMDPEGNIIQLRECVPV